MTQEHQSPTLLYTAVAQDFPAYSEIALSFPDEWELIQEIRAADTPLYIAGLAREEERPRRDHFPDLSAEVNQALTTYRHYKTFLPAPQPRLIVGFSESGGPGRVLGQEGLTIQLGEIGEAQAWYGGNFAVIWECYFFGSSLRSNWLGELLGFWRAVETDTAAHTFFTEAHEPDFPEGEIDYTDFLTTLGYRPLTTAGRWWNKSRSKRG